MLPLLLLLGRRRKEVQEVQAAPSKEDLVAQLDHQVLQGPDNRRQLMAVIRAVIR